MKNKLENIQEGISEVVHSFLGAEYLKDVGKIRQRTREIVKDIKSSSELKTYMGKEYTPIMTQLGKGDIHTSNFLKNIYELGHILGVKDLPTKKSGYYIRGKLVEANDPELKREDNKL